MLLPHLLYTEYSKRNSRLLSSVCVLPIIITKNGLIVKLMLGDKKSKTKTKSETKENNSNNNNSKKKLRTGYLRIISSKSQLATYFFVSFELSYFYIVSTQKISYCVFSFLRANLLPELTFLANKQLYQVEYDIDIV